MYCANCGYNSEGSVCPNCGSPMPDIQQENQNISYQSNAYQNNVYQNNDYVPQAQQSYNGQYIPHEQNNLQYQQQSYSQQPYNNESNINSYGQSSNDYQNNYPNNYQNLPQKNKNNNNIIVAIVAVAAVVIVGLLAVFVTSSLNKTEEETTTTTEALTEETEDYEDYNDTDVNVDRTEYSSSGVVLPDYEISGTYYVTADIGLVLRKGPGTNYSKILTIKYGNMVSAHGASLNVNGWYYVRYSNNYGWVSSDYLSTIKPYTTTKYKGDPYTYTRYNGIVIKYVQPRDGLNIRTGASKSCKKIATLPQDTEVRVLGDSTYDSNWVYVTAYTPYGDTYTGFVNRNYLYP